MTSVFTHLDGTAAPTGEKEWAGRIEKCNWPTDCCALRLYTEIPSKAHCRGITVINGVSDEEKSEKFIKDIIQTKAGPLTVFLANARNKRDE